MSIPYESAALRYIRSVLAERIDIIFLIAQQEVALGMQKMQGLEVKSM
jgi:hypothetical protein